MIPEATSAYSSTSGPAGQRNQRYAYLVARLRNRQMTMEEATELFGIMDGMLRASETARVALARAPPPSAPVEVALPKRAAPVTPSGGAGDDFFLLGLIAMGAGAGLLAALTRRLQESTATSSAAAGTSGSAPKST